MHEKLRFLVVLVVVTGLMGGTMISSTVSADPETGTKFGIPRLDLDAIWGGGEDWQTKIQVQNVGGAATWAAIVYWGTPGSCPPNETGSLSTWRRRWIPVNGVWTVTPPTGAESALVFSFANEPTSKPTVDSTADGQNLAVTVDRWGEDPLDGFEIASSYTAVAAPQMVGPGPPYQYFAPYVMYGYNGKLDTTLAIQNVGDGCIGVWLYYKQQGNCETQAAQHIEQLAPGEAKRIGPGADADLAFPPAISTGWLGSVYISANQPLAIVVDQLSLSTPTNQGVLLTYRGRPYGGWSSSQTETRYYADLLYRELSGWTSSIQVQNLTTHSLPAFVTVDFLDQSGGSILYLGDWVCRNGTTTFYLPAVTDLGIYYPLGYVGAAVIESHSQVGYPGDEHDGEPIFAVVDIKKTTMWDPSLGKWRPTTAGEIQGGAYNAHPEEQAEDVSGIALPFIARGEASGDVTSKIALRNNSNCNKIRGTLYIQDSTGTQVSTIPVPWLLPRHLKVFDLANFDGVAEGFIGAAKFLISVPDDVEQLCDTDHDGHVDAEHIMPSAVVLNYSWAAEIERDPPLTTLGDLTRVYEGIPFQSTPMIGYGDIWGVVSSYDAGDDSSYEDDTKPLRGVTVSVTNTVASATITDTTSFAGSYEIERATAGANAVTFSKNTFLTGTQSITLDVGEEKRLNCQMLCLVDIKGTVKVSDEDFSALQPLSGAAIEYSLSLLTGECGYSGASTDSTTSDAATGNFVMTVPLLDETLTFTVSKPGVIETRVFTMTIMDDSGGASYGSVTTDGSLPYLTAPDVPTYTFGTSFADHDCAWHPGATRLRWIDNTDTCAYSMVSGQVTVGGNAAVGWTVTATRLADGEIFTDTTTAGGVYMISLPTGIATQGSGRGTNGNEFNITVGATTQRVTFTGCGQAISVNFAF